MPAGGRIGRWNISDTNISENAVREATGRGWRGWWKVLDAWGAPKHSHSEIARFLAHEHGLSDWWSQTVTVQYERERGLRELGETPSGFQMGAQKTFLPDVDAAWSLISSSDGIEAWLGPGAPSELVQGESYRLLDGTTGEIRVVAPGSHFRLTWQPPPWSTPSTLQVRAVASPSGRGTVSFHHEGLPDQGAREAMVEHWKDRLTALQERWNARAERSGR